MKRQRDCAGFLEATLENPVEYNMDGVNVESDYDNRETLETTFHKVVVVSAGFADFNPNNDMTFKESVSTGRLADVRA